MEATVPVLATVLAAIRTQLPNLPFAQGQGPLSDRADVEREMTAAGFRDVRVERVTHAEDADSLEAFWARIQRTFAPLALLRQKLGDAAWAPVERGVYATLERDYGRGPVRLEMQAWIGVGTA
jgi:hypothetical protein